MEGASAGGGSHVEAHIPVMLTAAQSMQAVSAQMLSAAVPTAVPPAGLDEVSLKAAARLNSRAMNLVKTLDSGSWVLAGGAVEVENAAHSFLAKEAENAASFSGTAGAGGVPAPQLPAFPPPPTIPDLTMPDVPAPPGAIDAEYTSMLVNGGSGDAPHTAAAEFWTNTGQSLAEVSDVLGVARDALRNGWQSRTPKARTPRCRSFTPGSMTPVSPPLSSGRTGAPTSRVGGGSEATFPLPKTRLRPSRISCKRWTTTRPTAG